MKPFHTPLQAMDHWLDADPNFIFLRQPVDRTFIEYSRRQVYDQAKAIAAALHDLGLKKGDHVAMLSKNCAHWVMSDLAIMMGGFVSVPLYPTLDKDSINEILVHSESKAILIGKLDDYSAQERGIPKNLLRIGVELYGIDEQHSWEKLVEKDTSGFTPVEQDPESLLTIMYTSGTTGNPKGVMHLVKSFTRSVTILQEAEGVPDNGRYFSYLPLSHVAERVGLEMGAIFSGSSMSFPESLDTFAEDLALVQPTFFVAVPRIWQKFQEKILEKFSQKKLDTLLSIPLIGGIVAKKIRQKLGLSKAKFCFAGAAPTAVSLLEWYNKLGIEILQAYGMTEDSILSHFSTPKANKFGCVGQPLPGVEARLSPEGEIQIKNGALMVGYFKEPEKTAEVITDDGFLCTGDVGEYDHDRFLSITGRIKDQFKTDKGKYVTPSQIELKLSKNTDIEQVCVVGMGIPQPIALIVPSEGGQKKDRSELSKSISDTIHEINPTLQAHEKLSKAVVMKEEWSVDNGLMTPSMKVRRPRVEANHQEMYQSWFEEKDQVIFE